MSRPVVAFDLDDTLYLEREYVRSGFEAVGRLANERLGVADFAERAWGWFERGRRGDIFNRVLAELGWKDDRSLIQELVEAYRAHKPSIALLPDAAECLRLLRGRAVLALVTDGPAQSQRSKIGALGLGPFMDEIVVTDEWGVQYAKPHPRAFEHLEGRWRLTCSHFYYVGDNPLKDFSTPRARGWRTVRVRRPLGLHWAVTDRDGVGADLEVRDLLEFLRVTELAC